VISALPFGWFSDRFDSRKDGKTGISGFVDRRSELSHGGSIPPFPLKGLKSLLILALSTIILIGKKKVGSNGRIGKWP
jgi:hypothetical protein